VNAAVPADRWDGFVIDLDGVVWRGDEPIPGAADALGALVARGKRLVYLTNDPRSARAHYTARLRALGVPASAGDVLTAAAATAEFLRSHEDAGSRPTYAIGSSALKDELVAAGIELLPHESALQAEVVVVGGHDDFHYGELRAAVQALRRGARLYATGRDAVFPMPDGPWPGTGAILAAVEAAASTRAVVIGKPEPFMFEAARSQLAGCRRIAVVGDHLEADIAGGKRAGLETVLVLTGNSRREDVRAAATQPDLIVADLAALAQPTVRAEHSVG
jgi:glycerol-1-phosphatase